MKKKFFIFMAVAALLLVTFFGCSNTTRTRSRYVVPETYSDRVTSSRVNQNNRTIPNNKSHNNASSIIGYDYNRRSISPGTRNRNNTTSRHYSVSSRVTPITPNKGINSIPVR